MAKCKTVAARGTNEEIFREAVPTTQNDHHDDYRMYLANDTDDE